MSSLSKIKRLTKSVWMDLRYSGKFLGGTVKTRYAGLGAKDVANSDYDVLPLLFEGLVRDTDVLVDVGCGKGRVINWWLHQGFTNLLIGIELDEDVAREATRQFKKYKNVQIISGSILEKMPPTGTLFYLFNPFDDKVLRQFADQLKFSHSRNPRRIRILYYNPVHLNVFQGDAAWKIQIIEIKKPGFHKANLIELNARLETTT